MPLYRLVTSCWRPTWYWIRTRFWSGNGRGKRGSWSSGKACTTACIRARCLAPTSPRWLGEDFAGWDSSYTGAPIPLDQMREWRAAAVDRIQELSPASVLEIGMGWDYCLTQLAPGCVEYWGTDFGAHRRDPSSGGGFPALG